MFPSVTCYITPGKSKARRLCEAFAAGAGGVAVETSVLRPGPAAFYGVAETTRPLWRRAIEEKHDWYYLDNAYFDATRQRHFRVTRNALQATGRERPDWKRFADLKLGIQPWQHGGGHIVVCAQSDWYMRGLCGWAGGSDGWMREVIAALVPHTDRTMVFRRWQADKDAAAASLRADLRGAHALVTHSSAAANEALIAGIPVFVTGVCAASSMASGDLAAIEKPRYPDGRYDWAAALAGQQWTIEELREGVAWEALRA